MSIIKVRNCYIGSQKLDPISLGGGGIKAAYLGNVMVYGEYKKEDEVKYYFYDFRYDIGPHTIQFVRTNASPLTLCTPRYEDFNIEAIDYTESDGSYRQSGTLPNGDLQFSSFYYTLYLHNSLKDTHQLTMYYKYGNPPKSGDISSNYFNFPINYSNGTIESSDKIGGNHNYSIYKFQISFNLEIVKDKGDIHFWIGNKSSTPSQNYTVNGVAIYIRFNNFTGDSTNYFSIDKVNLNIAGKAILSKTTSANYYPSKTSIYTICSVNTNLGDSTSQIELSISGSITWHTNMTGQSIDKIILSGDKNEVLYIVQPHHSSSFSNSQSFTVLNTNHIEKKTSSQLYLDIYF